MATGVFDDTGDERRGGCGAYVLLIAVLTITGGAVAFYVYSHSVNKPAAPGEAAAVTATDARLTLADDDGGNMKSVNRDDKQEIWLRVTLQNAPVGKTLTLDCDWIDPAGKVVHRNHYTTKEIDKPVWPTHARFQFGAASPLGKWTVKLSHEGRTLKSLSFDVIGGGDKK